MDRNGLQVLERDECLRLLGTATLGRIGVTLGALPAVLPVNFVLDGDRILVRTGAGTKLDAATRGAVVAFEVDHIDPVSQGGWSVVVTGVATEVTADDDLRGIETLPLSRWAPCGGSHVVAISTELVAGRRIVTSASPAIVGGAVGLLG